MAHPQAFRSKRLKKTKSKIAGLRRSHGRFWKEARESVQLTQLEVAAVLGYQSGQFISNVEAGRCRYPDFQLPKIQKIYGLKASEIISLVMEEEELTLRHALMKD